MHANEEALRPDCVRLGRSNAVATRVWDGYSCDYDALPARTADGTSSRARGLRDATRI